MSAAKYIGNDFRGNPVTPQNLGQLLIDYSEYNKAISDFGLTSTPYWMTKAQRSPMTGQVIKPSVRTNQPTKNAFGQPESPAGYQINGDVQGATNYLKSKGLVNFSFDPVFAPATAAQQKDPTYISRTIQEPFSNPIGDYLAFGNQLAKVIGFNNPDLRANPQEMARVVAQHPTLLRDAWSWIDSHANQAVQKEKAKDKGGLGVIAEGLGQVAQFAGLASGLHGLTAGLGALTSGAGLGGAFNAGMSAAGGMTDLGGVIGNIVGNPAIGNIANVGQAALTGGVEGGLPGALTGAGGAVIGAGIGEAGGIGEFLADPLGSIGGAFNVAAGGGVGGLLNTDNAMASAAQVGPGSLASNTPPVTGPIADEIVTVTASPVTGGAYSGGSYGFLASTLANLGVPAGANLLVNESGNLTGYTLTAPGQAPVVGMVQTTPPDLVNGQPTGSAVGGTGQGGTPEAGGATGGQAQTGGGTGGASAIGGAVTDILGGGTGTSVIGSGTTGTGLAGGTTDFTGVGGSGTTGAGTGGAGTGPGTGATGSGGVSGTGGTGAGTGGLLDTGVTPGTGGTTPVTETMTDAEWQAILNSTNPPAEPTPQYLSSTIPQNLRPYYEITDLDFFNRLATPENIALAESMRPAAEAFMREMYPSPQPAVTTTPTPTPIPTGREVMFGSPEWIKQQIDNAMANPSPMVGMPSPGNTWAGQLTGEPVNFVSDTGTGTSTGIGTGTGTGTGTSTGAGTGNQGGLTDAELAALLTAGAVGVGLGLGGADTGMATATGTGVGTTGVGTGAGGVDTGTGAGGTGAGGTGSGGGFGSGLDLLFPQMQGLLETGFQPGTEADFGQYGPVGSIIKAGKSNIPQTPKRKKRGIRVNISGRARNA